MKHQFIAESDIKVHQEETRYIHGKKHDWFPVVVVATFFVLVFVLGYIYGSF